ncbi:hypothetical protein [Virgibacillus kimchii]
MDIEKILMNLIKSVEGLAKQVEVINSTMATKDDIKNMATKDDIKNMATKDDLAGMASKYDFDNMATKDDIQRLETKLDDHDGKIDRNFKQIAANSEKLQEYNTKNDRLEKIMETLSIRSIEQEGKIRNMRPAEYTPSK